MHSFYRCLRFFKGKILPILRFNTLYDRENQARNQLVLQWNIVQKYIPRSKFIFFSTRKLKILLFPNASINDAELLTSNCFYIHEQRAWIMSRLHDYLSMGFEILVFHLFYSL